MNLDSAQLLFVALVVFFGLLVPFVIYATADAMQVLDITRWRSIKAGLGGLVGLVLGLKIGSDQHSYLLGVGLMCGIWAAWIHFFLKTSFFRALGIWFVTQGSVMLVALAVNYFVDVQSKVVQLFAAR